MPPLVSANPRSFEDAQVKCLHTRKSTTSFLQVALTYNFLEHSSL